MRQYRKRPVIVEAEQWFPGRPIPAAVLDEPTGNYFVTTIQGQTVMLTPGDWIIRESDGVHHYPCSAAEFARIYEEVFVDRARGCMPLEMPLP